MIHVDAAVEEVAAEVARAMAKFDSFNSPHEGWAVIKEEMDELWEHVRANTARSGQARTEAIHIAAMAVRYALDLCPKEEQAGHYQRGRPEGVTT